MGGTTGEGVFRGPANDFPFDNGQGLFEIRFRLEDAVLDYTPGWPRLEGARADVTFSNRGLRVESGQRVACWMSKSRSMRAWIDDLARRWCGSRAGQGAGRQFVARV